MHLPKYVLNKSFIPFSQCNNDELVSDMLQ
jgi:hypothetical protein